MRVLLKEGARRATAASILVLPKLIETTLETLSGEADSNGGIVAEAESAVVADAISTAVKDRAAPTITPRKLLKEVEWMAKALGPYEIGSEIGLHFNGCGCELDDSQARRIDGGEGLSEADAIAVGPTISWRTLMNVGGRVISINNGSVVVELEVGDRDRIQCATGKEQPARISIPFLCVEKVS